MAWVSVHDGVNGPKLRKLAKAAGVSKAEALGALVTLWLWGLHNAERTGEIKEADYRTIAAAIPSDMLSTETDQRRLVEALISTGWIDNIDGVLYLHDWDEWQEQWYKFLEKKAYDAERKRNKRKEALEQRLHDCSPGSTNGDVTHDNDEFERPKSSTRRNTKWQKVRGSPLVDADPLRGFRTEP